MKDSFWAFSELLRIPEADCPTRVFERRETIFTQGSPACCMYYIRSGAVKLSAISRGDQEHVARIAGAGETVGYWALSSNGLYVFSATALERTEVREIRRETFLIAARERPDILHRLVQVLCDDMVLKERISFNFSKKSVRERVAGTLLLLQEKFGVPTESGVRIDVEFSRKELASLAGTVIESVVRVLTSLKDEGILAPDDGRKLVVAKRDALDEIAGDRIL